MGGTPSMSSHAHRNTPITPRCPSDYRIGKEIGQGSFSTVHVVREIATNMEYAMKIVDKQHVRRNRAISSALMEKEVLPRIDHVFIIRLCCTFQDETRLFYVLEYAPRGEILTYLNRLTSFSVPCAQFYAAEILTALHYLHDHSIVHRDVKPENVLLTERMHIKLADFGSAIILNDPKVKAPDFTGTPEYVSPEMLSVQVRSDEDTSPSSSSAATTKTAGNHSFETVAYLMDYWALGCVIYQFISGRPPFRLEQNQHPYEIFSKINNLSYTFMAGFDPTAKDLVQRLLVVDPLQRLGSAINGGPSGLRKHSFFTGIQWNTLPQQTPPILVPNLEPIAPVDWDQVTVKSTEAVKYHLSDELTEAITELTNDDRVRLLEHQSRHNPYHRFVRNRLIMKQGILFKRRGLFARRRMFLLTEGPHLFYVDMDAMVLKGEIPWSNFLTLELKSDKLFFIRVPNRTYYLEDPSAKAIVWIDRIGTVKQFYYADPPIREN